ncbi:MAG: YdcF family protein [Candidatus Hydrogenedentes bacterium]|nr:YdcF family protein [Candidatus Hydrogenedentota bacterium]
MSSVESPDSPVGLGVRTKLHPARRLLKKTALWSLVASFGWLCALGIAVWRYGAVDHAARSDCIVVLGAAVQGQEPSPVFEERIRHGVNLYERGLASKLVFTGGTGAGQNRSESSAGAALAVRMGVPRDAILTEEQSHTTRQNLAGALAVMRGHGLRSAIIVSDPLHMKRAMMMADDLGMNAVSSPTPTSRYRSFKTQLGFLIRELYFFHHYLLTGD